MKDEQSRVLTLVFSDLADSTALKTARGDAAAHDLIVKHREHVTRVAQESAGRIIDWAGDGCFLTFETSSAGVMFALRLQQVHAEHPDLPGVRIGIHMGEVTEAPGPQGPDGPPRIDGLAVDLAARVSGLAKPGQVLMSSAVYNSARQRLGVDAFGQPIIWQAHGTYSLKGFDQPLDIGEAGLEGIAPLQAPEASEKARPIGAPQRESSKSRAPVLIGLLGVIAIALVLLVLRSFLAVAPDTSSPTAASPPDTALPDSVAVMYFENLTDPADPDNLEATLASLLTFELSSSETLEVLPRQRLYDIGKQLGVGPDDDIDRSVATEIATRAGVTSMVVGTTMLAGEQIRVSCELIEVATGRLLHSCQASGTEEEIFVMAEVLGGQLRNYLRHEADPVALTERLTNSIPAFKAYVRGETHLHKSEFPAAVREFAEATELDPDFALAHYWLAISFSWFTVDEAPLPARRAYELIDRFPPSYRSTVEATLRFVEDDWRRAFELLNAALDTDLDNKEALYLLSEIYVHSHEVGDWSKAVDVMEHILEVDPSFTLVFDHLMSGYIALGEERKLENLLRLAEDVKPDDVAPLRALWAAWNGQPEEAWRILEGTNDSYVMNLRISVGLALRLADFDSAHEAFERATNSLSYPPDEIPILRGLIEVYTGDFDAALRTWTEFASTWSPRQGGRSDGYRGWFLVFGRLYEASLFLLKGDPAQAQAEAARAAETHPNSFGALCYAGYYALENDDLASAQAYLQDAKELADRANHPALAYFVQILEAAIELHRSEHARARALLEDVLESEQFTAPLLAGEALVRHLLARTHLELGNADRAAEVLQNMGPDGFWANEDGVLRIQSLFTLAKLKLQLGDPDAAREYLTRFLAYWGNADWELDEVDEAKILLAQLERGNA